MRIAKLLVPAGALVQASGGDTFSPTQLGFCGLLPAFFLASIPPSWNVDDDSVKSCALATPTALQDAATIALAANNVLMTRFMTFPPYGTLPSGGECSGGRRQIKALW